MIPAGGSVVPVTAQAAGAFLLCAAFAFLWRQSSVIYFGLWSAAWATQTAAFATSGELWICRGLQVLSLLLLGVAGRAGLAAPMRPWRPALKALLAVPIFVAILLAFGWWPARAALASAVFLYNFTGVRAVPGIGGRIFRYALVAAAGLAWVSHLPWGSNAASLLSAVLVLSAMAMWIESQEARVHDLGHELDRVRRETARDLDLDRLTGLLNQSALEKRIQDSQAFLGVVAVCDMDEFKEVNDRYGHLTGDEILRNIGHLLRASIRQEDEAFRWGGDEFVILFHNENEAVAQRRMSAIEERLRGFRVRGHGALPITFSWGTAEAAGRPLREVLDQADQRMYGLKRRRREGTT